MQSGEIRKKYLEYFKQREHAVLPSFSLIPENDPSTLFTSSGMQPLVPYLTGEPHPEGKRLVDIQKSFRAQDIEEVGDNRHTTCFEMMGNWSLGDYFKAEQLRWFFEFLTEELGMDPGRLYVTVFKGNEKIGVARDTESVEIWKDIFSSVGIEAGDVEDSERKGISNGRIFYYDESKNWWSRAGAPANMPLGEIGGPDSEVFYDLGADLKRHENSQWASQPCHVNCDCGRFIEIGNSVFMEFIKTKEGFEPLDQKNVDFGGGLERMSMILQGKDNIFETDLYIGILDKLTELSGGQTYNDNIQPFEVIADHLKGAVFIMGDDKGIGPSNLDQGYLVRRLIRRAIRYGRQLGITKQGWTREIAGIVINTYSETYGELERNQEFVLAEMAGEEEKFMKTLEKGEKYLKDIFTKNNGIISGKEAFNLYQTYGFPKEMVIEEIERLSNSKGVPDNLNINAFDDVQFEEQFNAAMQEHQTKSRTATEGKFKGGLADASYETTRLHTSAHLLLEALRRVLGDHVTQKGSNITADRLRFDFSHPNKLSDEEKQKVEDLVNQAIGADLPVSYEEMPLEKAKELGAMGVFESKYGEKVKVYTVGGGDEVFSREICGGPHVERTGELGQFRIKKEQSSSAGVRRIKAKLE